MVWSTDYYSYTVQLFGVRRQIHGIEDVKSGWEDHPDTHKTRRTEERRKSWILWTMSLVDPSWHILLSKQLVNTESQKPSAVGIVKINSITLIPKEQNSFVNYFYCRNIWKYPNWESGVSRHSWRACEPVSMRRTKILRWFFTKTKRRKVWKASYFANAHWLCFRRAPLLPKE